MAEKCILLERPHMAAIFVTFAKDEDREKIKKLLSNSNKRELRTNIKELEEFGIAPIITKSVFNILELFSNDKYLNLNKIRNNILINLLL